MAMTGHQRGRFHKGDRGLEHLAKQAAESPTATSQRRLQKCADASVPVQRVKTVPNAPEVFKGNMLFGVIDTYKKMGDVDPQTLLDDSRAHYTRNRQRGQRIKAEIEALKTDPGSKVVKSQESARSDQIHTANYETRAAPQATEGHYVGMTRAAEGTEDAYTNNLYVPDGAIVTNSNHAKKDPNRIKEEYLNNSEVFWQQWKEAVDADTQTGPFKNTRKKYKQKQLREVIRTSIMNPETLLTVHYALPDDQYFQTGTTVTFGPDQEEFEALLGTPNGRGVGHLLKDHFHEMSRKSFGDVTVLGDETGLRFTFV